MIKFIKRTGDNLTGKLTAGTRNLAEVKLLGVIFKGDLLSLLHFLVAMMPLNPILTKWQEKINQVMYMDDIKLLAKN